MMKNIFIALCFGLLVSSCTKHEVNKYEINNVPLQGENTQKNNLKSDLQLISIMYTDLFGQSIPNNQLKYLNQAYTSFGDKDVVIERITQNFILDPLALIPSDSTMRSDPEKFISDAYKRFYVRTPTESEVWFLKNEIEGNTTLRSLDVFYAILTSDEYKYY